MKTYYQVFISFKMSGGKPQLTALSFYSAHKYFPSLVPYGNSPLSFSRCFHSVPQATQYINYLFSRYPQCGLSCPVLDVGQPLLF